MYAVLFELVLNVGLFKAVWHAEQCATWIIAGCAKHLVQTGNQLCDWLCGVKTRGAYPWAKQWLQGAKKKLKKIKQQNAARGSYLKGLIQK